MQQLTVIPQHLKAHQPGMNNLQSYVLLFAKLVDPSSRGNSSFKICIASKKEELGL